MRHRSFKSKTVRKVWVSEITNRSEYYVKDCCLDWTGAPPRQVIQWYEWKALHNSQLNGDLPGHRPVYQGTDTPIPSLEVCGLLINGANQECFVHNGNWEVSGGGGGFLVAGGFNALNVSEFGYTPTKSRACLPDNSGLNSVSKLPVVMGIAMMRPRLFDVCQYEPRPDQRIPFYHSYFFGVHSPINVSIHGIS